MSEIIPAVEERQVKAATTNEPAIVAMENLIRNYVKGLNELNIELREIRQMYTDSFINDPVYHAKKELVRKENNELKGLKLSIAKQEGVAVLEQKVKDLSFKIRERKKALSVMVVNYKEQTGAMQLQLFDEEIVDITLSAKLTRHSKLKGVNKRGKKRK